MTRLASTGSSFPSASRRSEMADNPNGVTPGPNGYPSTSPSPAFTPNGLSAGVPQVSPPTTTSPTGVLPGPNGYPSGGGSVSGKAGPPRHGVDIFRHPSTNRPTASLAAAAKALGPRRISPPGQAVKAAAISLNRQRGRIGGLPQNRPGPVER